MPVTGTTRWTAAQVNRAKPVIFLLALYPLIRWLWLAVQHTLSANPQEFLIRSSGIWALVGLLLTLSITPLRRFVQQPALVRLRRMLGLFSFFYTVLHVFAWALWERGLSPAFMWQDVTERTFIAVGFVATLPMLVLAITSTQGWMRRLGRHWQMVHRCIYAIAALSIWHFWLVRSGKNNYFEPSMYALVLMILLLARTGSGRGHRRRTR